MAVNERKIALEILYKIEYEGAFSNIAIDEVLSSIDVDRRGSGFITQLVYGTITHKFTLDYYIGKFSSVKLKKLSKYVLLILRLTLYQLIYLDKVPSSAAVNEGVKLTSRYASKSRGFVNGVLRSIVRFIDEHKEPLQALFANDKSLTDIDIQSITYSFPREVCEEWSAFYSVDKASEIMDALNQIPTMSACVNTMQTTANDLCKLLTDEGGTATLNPIFGGSVDIKGITLAKSKAFTSGLFHIQDPSASLAVHVLDPKPNESMIDVCAAPGGKSVLSAELMQNNGEVIACDIYEHKLGLIEQNAKRLKLDIIKPTLNDATVLKKEYINKFDRVLIDAPCSGFGIIRRKPEIKYQMTERGGMDELQFKILETSSNYVKSNGTLVYSTCTIEPNENELLIDKFLKKHPDFTREDISKYIPTELKSETTKQGYITILPTISDGFFIAKLKRK